MVRTKQPYLGVTKKRCTQSRSNCSVCVQCESKGSDFWDFRTNDRKLRQDTRKTENHVTVTKSKSELMNHMEGRGDQMSY